MNKVYIPLIASSTVQSRESIRYRQIRYPVLLMPCVQCTATTPSGKGKIFSKKESTKHTWAVIPGLINSVKESRERDYYNGWQSAYC